MGKKVLVAGTFDLIHPGHIRLLQEAKKLAGGDGQLVVVVARDINVRKFKGRDPVLSEDERLEIVRNLKPVDRAILGDLNDPLIPIYREQPDLIALGYDQWADERWLREELAKRWNLTPEVVRLKKFSCRDDSSSEIIRRILSMFCLSSGGESF